MLPLEEVTAPSTVALLSRFEVDPILAVWPRTLGACERAVKTLADAGRTATVWPMLADAEGRWLGAANVEAFAAFAGDAQRVTGATEIVLDLEPPIEKLRGSLAMKELPISTDMRGFLAARARIARLVVDLHEAGAKVTATVPPPALLEGFELLLGTPVGGVAWDSVSPMVYASIAEGWSRGLFRREDARAFVSWGARAAVGRFGRRAAASLGAVGTGALGDEPVYRSPYELADDTAIAVAAGVTDLALFELAGVLHRPPAEAWFEAFTDPPTTSPTPATTRIEALVSGAAIASSLFSRFIP